MKKTKPFLIILAILAAMILLWQFAAVPAGRAWIRRRYPVRYVEPIKTNAQTYRLNPNFVLAVARCESGLEANVVSRAGAVGVMQIMPDTGRWIAEELSEDAAYTDALLTDPAVNIRYGCWYLRYLCDLFDGDFQNVVCAYNAGQGNVQKWLADPALSSGGKLHSIPFAETERYYTRVYNACMAYEELYPALFSGDAEEAEAVASLKGAWYTGLIRWIRRMRAQSVSLEGN